ncbi:related to DNA polymerase mu [Ustilago trichophora]|uniref:DNA polymerase n=1 Tax=Ustilago trichophora TaxID=86804 RepID=A0A5C3DUB3_9BASI|nr:related to DNA polymerase mu [Ustilago trichophora]
MSNPHQPQAGIRYQNHIGAPSRSSKTPQRTLSQSTRIHILRDKLDEDQATRLELLAQQLGAQVTSDAEAANVVVTVLRAPKRILKCFGDGEANVAPFQPKADQTERMGGKAGGQERNEEEVVAKALGEEEGRDWRRFVVTPEWLEAVQREGTLVDPDLFPAVVLKQEEEADKVETKGLERKRKRSPSESPLLPTHHSSAPFKPADHRTPSSSSTASPIKSSLSSSTVQKTSSTPSSYYDPIYPPPGCPPWQNTRYACRRPSPLISPNQVLIADLETIRNERKLTGDTYSEMAYMRAISALKAFPFRIPDPALDPPEVFDKELLELRLGEVEKLKGVGKKVYSLVKQFYALPQPESAKEKGITRPKAGEPRIVEAKVIKRDKAIFVMTAFTELYGIGPIGAREAYNSGARSFSDVLHRGKSLATHLSAKESVRILGDLRKPIGREECRAITEDIMKLVKSLLPTGVEVKYEICGGYRRGKERTYDLDVIIGHSEPPSRALHMRLLESMKSKGLISHIVNVSTPAPSFTDPDPLPTTSTATAAPSEEGGTIHIDIANIVVLPSLSPNNPAPIHRRVDLVFCPLRVYGATVLGWTGSMTFERDLRLWAKSKGFNFSFDGLTNLAEESVLVTKDERDVFNLLGLEWVPPEWRNCDA